MSPRTATRETNSSKNQPDYPQDGQYYTQNALFHVTVFSGKAIPVPRGFTSPVSVKPRITAEAAYANSFSHKPRN